MSAWCSGSGSEDEFRVFSEFTEEVQCNVCKRYFYLTKALVLPRHKVRLKKRRPSTFRGR